MQSWREQAFFLEQTLLATPRFVPAFHCFLESVFHQLQASCAKLNLIMPTVFISYAHPTYDENTAEIAMQEAWTRNFTHKLADHLAVCGFSVLIDKNDSVSGNNPIKFMNGAVENSDIILIVATRTFNFKCTTKKVDREGVSHDYYVKYEFGRAWQRHKESRDSQDSSHDVLRPILISGSYDESCQFLRFDDQKYAVSVQEFAVNAHVQAHNSHHSYLRSFGHLLSTLIPNESIQARLQRIWESEIRIFADNPYHARLLDGLSGALLNHVLQLSERQTFRDLGDLFCNCVDFHLLQQSSSEDLKSPVIFEVPRFHDDLFQGREYAMVDLRLRFEIDIARPRSGLKKVVIVGMQGIGKSRFTRQFIALHQHLYQLVWVFNANEDLDRQFVNLARAINDHLDELIVDERYRTPICVDQDTPAKSVKEAVLLKMQHISDWFWNFDDIYEESQLASYLPEISCAGRKHVLGSTSNAGWQHDRFELGVLTDDTAMALFSQISGCSAADRKLLYDVVVKNLGNLPLAIWQVAKLVRHDAEMTLSRFVTDFAAVAPQPLRTLDANSPEDYRKTVSMNIQLALRQLRQSDHHSGLMVLDLCAHIMPTDIPVKLLKVLIPERERRRKSIEILRDLHFIFISENKKMIYLHPLIHRLVRDIFLEVSNRNLDDIIRVLWESVFKRKSDELLSPLKLKIFLPHLDEFIGRLSDAQLAQKPVKKLIYFIAHMYKSLGTIDGISRGIHYAEEYKAWIKRYLEEGEAKQRELVSVYHLIVEAKQGLRTHSQRDLDEIEKLLNKMLAMAMAIADESLIYDIISNYYGEKFLLLKRQILLCRSPRDVFAVLRTMWDISGGLKMCQRGMVYYRTQIDAGATEWERHNACYQYVLGSYIFGVCYFGLADLCHYGMVSGNVLGNGAVFFGLFQQYGFSIATLIGSLSGVFIGGTFNFFCPRYLNNAGLQHFCDGLRYDQIRLKTDYNFALVERVWGEPGRDRFSGLIQRLLIEHLDVVLAHIQQDTSFTEYHLAVAYFNMAKILAMAPGRREHVRHCFEAALAHLSKARVSSGNIDLAADEKYIRQSQQNCEERWLETDVAMRRAQPNPTLNPARCGFTFLCCLKYAHGKNRTEETQVLSSIYSNKTLRKKLAEGVFLSNAK